MCSLPEMFCGWCLTESYGQLLRYPVEEVTEGLRLCRKHKQLYLLDSRYGDLLLKRSIDDHSSLSDDNHNPTGPSVQHFTSAERPSSAPFGLPLSDEGPGARR